MCGAASSAARVAVRRVALAHHDGRNAYITGASNTPATAPLRRLTSWRERPLWTSCDCRVVRRFGAALVVECPEARRFDA
jgi:hypothetical protein